jgi:hypothetical protein
MLIIEEKSNSFCNDTGQGKIRSDFIKRRAERSLRIRPSPKKSSRAREDFYQYSTVIPLSFA